MRAGIYIRVSTDEQAKEGYSIEAQRKVLNAWAVIKGASSIEEYIDEGYSAKNLNRPAVRRMIDACNQRQLDAVIVWKSDRLTRNLRDLLMLTEDVFRDNSVQFISCTETIDTSTPTGRLVLNVLGAFAQNERENTSERTTMVMRELAKTGKHMGGRPPYGYSVDPNGRYMLNPAEAGGVRMLFEMKLSGRSYGDIIAALDAAGYKSRSGKTFEKNTLYDMLRNEKYTGTYIYNRAAPANRDGQRNNRASKPEEEWERIPGAMPAIITYDQWKAVNRMTKGNKAIGGENTAKNVYVLSGIVRCGACSKPMTIANAGRNRDGSYWRAYRCKNKCVKGVEYRKLETCVFDFLEHYAGSDEFQETILNLAREYNAYAAEDSAQDLQQLRNSLSQAHVERDNLFKLACKSDNPPESLLDEISRRDSAIHQLQADLEKAENSVLFIKEEDILRRLSTITGIRSLDKQAQKMVVKELVEAVTIYTDSIEITLTTTAIGGPDSLPSAMVALLKISIANEYITRHKLPSRFLK
jgi:site-specific DNA recombinase